MPSSAESLRKIPLSEPLFKGNEWRYVKECLDSGWVSSVGPFVERFEREIASYAGAKHAVAVVNGTAALHVALQGIGLQPGEIVLVSDLTFIAPVNAIRYGGGVPVFIDADPATWQMDVRKLERFLQAECEPRSEACIHKASGRRVRAILPVHILGLACEMDRIVSLARSHKLSIVEDAAEGLGVRYQKRLVGTHGDIGVFSFNGNKIITAGGGGMLVTDQAALAQKIKYLTTQAKDDPVEYFHREIGYNYRLNNIQAALGAAQLEQLPDHIARKRELAETYRAALRSLEGWVDMPRPAQVDATFWLYTVLLPKGVAVTERKQCIARLRAKGVEARPLWHPIHSLPPYRNEIAYDIQVAPDLYQRAVSLPSSPGLRPDDIAYVIDTLKDVWNEIKR